MNKRPGRRMKYAKDIAMIAGGMLLGYAMNVTGTLHWVALAAGATLAAAGLTVLGNEKK